MVKMTYDEAEKLEESVSEMTHLPGCDGDNWYPEKAEIEAYITDFNKADIRFLMSLLYPKFELNSRQKETQKYVRDLLMDEKVITYLDNEEQEDLSDILNEYNKRKNGGN